MTIKSISKLRSKKQQIDLTGPDGNAFVLLGYAKNYCRQLGKNWEDIRFDMTKGDYEHLVEVFDREFGEFVDLFR